MRFSGKPPVADTKRDPTRGKQVSHFAYEYWMNMCRTASQANLNELLGLWTESEIGAESAGGRQPSRSATPHAAAGGEEGEEGARRAAPEPERREERRRRTTYRAARH